jgi:hypothetical protein
LFGLVVEEQQLKNPFCCYTEQSTIVVLSMKGWFRNPTLAAELNQSIIDFSVSSLEEEEEEENGGKMGTNSKMGKRGFRVWRVASG